MSNERQIHWRVPDRRPALDDVAAPAASARRPVEQRGGSRPAALIAATALVTAAVLVGPPRASATPTVLADTGGSTVDRGGVAVSLSSSDHREALPGHANPVDAVTSEPVAAGHRGLTGTSPTSPSAGPVSADPAIVDINTTIGYAGGRGAGTGMVLTSTGLILTNNHVISGATAISVTYVGNGKVYGATVVGYDRTRDVAVLQLTHASGLRTITTAQQPLRHGTRVIGVGNAGGVGGTPSHAPGTVTALGQTITANDQADGTSETLRGLIVTSAAIQPGDSGGPLLNTRGQVVGMDTAAAANSSYTGRWRGFAIPIAQAIVIARQIRSAVASATVHIGETAMLGVAVLETRTPPAGYRLAINGLLRGGPAARAGLHIGELLLTVDGHPVATGDALSSVLSAEKVGARVRVNVLDSSGHRRTVTVALVAGPPK